jgi:hypothetical protein
VDNIKKEGWQPQSQIGKKTSPGIFNQRTTVFTEVNSVYARNR